MALQDVLQFVAAGIAIAGLPAHSETGSEVPYAIGFS
jgi:hypothetical protein